MNQFEQDVYNRYMEKIAAGFTPRDMAMRAGNALRGGAIGAGIGALANMSREALTRYYNKFKGIESAVRPTYGQRALQGAKWGGGIGAVAGALRSTDKNYSRYDNLMKDFKNNVNSNKAKFESAMASLKDNEMRHSTLTDELKRLNAISAADSNAAKRLSRKIWDTEFDLRSVDRAMDENRLDIDWYNANKKKFDEIQAAKDQDWKSGLLDSLLPHFFGSTDIPNVEYLNSSHK